MAKVNLSDSIQMVVTDPQPCCKEFAFTIPAAAVESERAKVVNYLSGMVRLPGFRAGKAPAALVKTKFTAEIKEELRNRIVGGAFAKIEEDKSLEILAVNFKEQPDFDKEGDIAFTFVVNVAPEMNLGDYKAIKVDLPTDAVTEEQVDERLKLYRTMYGSFADVEGGAQADDMLKVNYEGDFALPEDASPSLRRRIAAKDSFLMLSEPETIPGCIAALTGAEKGKDYSFTANFPENCDEAALSGKSVNYKVSVLAVQRRKELTDEELIAKIKMDSIEDMRKMIRQGLERDSEAKRRQSAAEAVYKRLDETAGNFPLPPALLENEINRELQNIARTAVKSEADADAFKKELDAHRKEAEGKAKESLRRRLILTKLAKLENLTVSDSEIADRINAMSAYYGMKANDMRAMLNNNGAMDELRVDFMADKALSTLVEQILK